MSEPITLDLDDEKNRLLVLWDEKNGQREADLHNLGGQFVTFSPQWTYRFPVELEVVRKVNKYGKANGGVKATEKLKERLTLMSSSVKKARAINGGTADADLSELLMEEYPATAQALRPHQRAAAQFIAERDSVLLADHPGLGKSLSSIAALVGAGVEGDILILAPSAAIQISWPHEIKRWAPDDEVITVIGGRKAREAELAKLRFLRSKGKRRWVLCNLEMAKVKYTKPSVTEDGKKKPGGYHEVYPELFWIDYFSKKKNPREWSAIITDESHRALITKKTRPHEQTQIRCGFGKLHVAEGGKRIAVSGTPFRGKLENLWGTLNWLFPGKYTAYWNWIEQWFTKEENYFGGSTVGDLSCDEAAFYESIEPFTLRRTKSEVAKDLPPKTYAGFVPDGIEIEYDGQEKGLVGHWLPMLPKQQKAYDEMQMEALARLDEGVVVANGVLAEMTRLKQFASTYGTLGQKLDADGYTVDVFKPDLPSNKLEWLFEFLAERGVDKELHEGPEANKVVVASQFTATIKVFEKALNDKGIQTVKITGGVSAKDRRAAAEIFQTDTGPQVFLLNTMAGGVALTLDRADDIVILDETFVPDDQEQVEDRVHRISRNHNVTVHYVRSLGTIEESIARKTHGRETNIKQVLDGERGVDFARQILQTNAVR